MPVSVPRDGYFTMRISDDGRGLDFDALKHKAIEMNLCTAEVLDSMDRSELCSLIFTDRLSTKDLADPLSGRGMGMSAFRRPALKWEAGWKSRQRKTRARHF
jgi:two-component system chemotaxis sensor kinase CheA